MRDARRVARKERRNLQRDDLVARLPKRIAFSQEDLRRIAVHEAGHAIVQAKVGDGEIVQLRIKLGLNPQGQVAEVGFLEVAKSEFRGRTRRDYEAQLMVHLAGLAAEELVLGEIADGGGGSTGTDLANATQIATEMEASLGLGDSLVHLFPSGSRQIPELLLADRILRQRVEVTLDKAYEDACAILEEHKSAHEALVDALMQRHKLEGREVLEIISGVGEEDCQRVVGNK